MGYPSNFKDWVVIDKIVEAVDVVPTILEYCGIQTLRIVQGKSLKPFIEGKTGSHREDALIEYFTPFNSRSSAIRIKEYKYFCISEEKEILFDLKQDPDELKNVVDDNRYAGGAGLLHEKYTSDVVYFFRHATVFQGHISLLVTVNESKKSANPALLLDLRAYPVVRKT